MQFVVGTYLLNGTFLGYQPLTTQLQACAEPAGIPTWNRPGQTSEITCKINVNGLAMSGGDTLFFDLCKISSQLVLKANGTLYPVPVRIKNYKNENGQSINSDDKPTNDNRLFRRFMWIDMDSGVVNGAVKYLRVPTMIKFWMKTVSGQDGKIYVPIMDILYSERAVAYLSDADSSDISTPTVNQIHLVYICDQLDSRLYKLLSSSDDCWGPSLFRRRNSRTLSFKELDDQECRQV